MQQDHDFVYLPRGKRVMHSTACRDYLCGQCGGPLVTKCVGGNWQTLCTRDAEHDGIVKKMTWLARQQQALADQAEARDVFAHLPAELQEAITSQLKGGQN